MKFVQFEFIFLQANRVVMGVWCLYLSLFMGVGDQREEVNTLVFYILIGTALPSPKFSNKLENIIKNCINYLLNPIKFIDSFILAKVAFHFPFEDNKKRKS